MPLFCAQWLRQTKEQGEKEKKQEEMRTNKGWKSVRLACEHSFLEDDNLEAKIFVHIKLFMDYNIHKYIPMHVATCKKISPVL